ncbi:MAG TPA: hypothetical protein VGN86_15720 [Pyrinomonadaceae bacterium]|jgi:hypothetical protein|nr:hypothetical protein [Pyrinomonadaceae bacterium]
MRKSVLIGILVCVLLPIFSVIVSAQDASKNGTGSAAAGTSAPISAASTPVDLARAAIAGQGGEKFRNLKSLVLIGTVELYAPNSTQSLAGKFAIVTAGEKVRIDVTAPVLSFQQIFDGQHSYNSLPNMPPLPPPSTFGLPVLLKYDQPGYKVEAIPDQKKRRGFKITDPEGNSTDFYVDPANGHLTGFLTQRNGYTFAVENSKTKEIDGVLVPYSFSWRLEMKQGAAFAEYTVKDAKLNQPVGDDVFAIPN